MDDRASRNVIITIVVVTEAGAIKFGDGHQDHEQERRKR